MTTSSFATAAYSASRNMAAGLLGAPTGLSAGTGFEGLVRDTLAGMTESGRKAEAQATLAAAGKADLVDVVTAVAETETALQTLVAVRDRMISAYEEIMRMQV